MKNILAAIAAAAIAAHSAAYAATATDITYQEFYSCYSNYGDTARLAKTFKNLMNSGKYLLFEFEPKLQEDSGQALAMDVTIENCLIQKDTFSIEYPPGVTGCKVSAVQPSYGSQPIAARKAYLGDIKDKFMSLGGTAAEFDAAINTIVSGLVSANTSYVNLAGLGKLKITAAGQLAFTASRLTPDEFKAVVPEQAFTGSCTRAPGNTTEMSYAELVQCHGSGNHARTSRLVESIKDLLLEGHKVIFEYQPMIVTNVASKGVELKAELSDCDMSNTVTNITGPVETCYVDSLKAIMERSDKVKQASRARKAYLNDMADKFVQYGGTADNFYKTLNSMVAALVDAKKSDNGVTFDGLGVFSLDAKGYLQFQGQRATPTGWALEMPNKGIFAGKCRNQFNPTAVLGSVLHVTAMDLDAGNNHLYLATSCTNTRNCNPVYSNVQRSKLDGSPLEIVATVANNNYYESLLYSEQNKSLYAVSCNTNDVTQYSANGAQIIAAYDGVSWPCVGYKDYVTNTVYYDYGWYDNNQYWSHLKSIATEQTPSFLTPFFGYIGNNKQYKSVDYTDESGFNRVRIEEYTSGVMSRIFQTQFTLGTHNMVVSVDGKSLYVVGSTGEVPNQNRRIGKVDLISGAFSIYGGAFCVRPLGIPPPENVAANTVCFTQRLDKMVPDLSGNLYIHDWEVIQVILPDGKIKSIISPYLQ